MNPFGPTVIRRPLNPLPSDALCVPPQGAAIAVTGGGSLSLQSVGGSISGLTITGSTFSMDAASTASLGGTIRFENAATGELAGTSIAAGSSLAVVGVGTAVSLENCTVAAAVSRHMLHAFGKLLMIPCFFAAASRTAPCLSASRSCCPPESRRRAPLFVSCPRNCAPALHLALAMQRAGGACRPR